VRLNAIVDMAPPRPGSMLSLGAELARGGSTRLAPNAFGSARPRWTLDGKRVAFSFGPLGAEGLQWAPVDGSSKPELLLGNPAGRPDSFKPDGKTLLYESAGPAHI